MRPELLDEALIAAAGAADDWSSANELRRLVLHTIDSQLPDYEVPTLALVSHHAGQLAHGGQLERSRHADGKWRYRLPGGQR